MPQLIAMVIVVVGAMIYMFQTFGGTGDKIEGVAQKSSIITEVNNIKNGLQLALRTGDISLANTTLESLSDLEYFADQINNELDLADDGTTTMSNTYQAISFGSDDTLEISLVLPGSGANDRPGLFINLSQGKLATNAAFLESQITNDLSALGSIDSLTTAAGNLSILDAEGNFTAASTVHAGDDSDGMFTVYFKDLPRNSIEP